jgi:hypothetical protein
VLLVSADPAPFERAAQTLVERVPATFAEADAVFCEKERLWSGAPKLGPNIVEVPADRFRGFRVERDLARPSLGLGVLLADDDMPLVVVGGARQADVF